MRRFGRLSVFILSLGMLLGSTAGAKTKKRVGWSFDTVWSTTIRLLRVDRGYKLTDKDKETGYILFVFPGSGSVKKCPAAIELVRVKGHEGQPEIQIQLNIAHQPSYVEIHLLDKLERKLLSEHGRPPVHRRPAKKPAPSEKPKKKP